MTGLRPAIHAAGGLHSSADLARRWGMTKQNAALVTAREDFPRPIETAGGLRLWTAEEADAYLAAYRGGVWVR